MFMIMRKLLIVRQLEIEGKHVTCKPTLLSSHSLKVTFIGNLRFLPRTSPTNTPISTLRIQLECEAMIKQPHCIPRRSKIWEAYGD